MAVKNSRREDLAELVRRAAEGNEDAWTYLVHQYDNLLYSVTGTYRLDPSLRRDVVQTTWLRLFEQIGRIRQPEQIVAWLMTTARRECLRMLRSTARELPVEDFTALQPPPDEDPVAHLALEPERGEVLRNAMAELPERQRHLLDALLREEAPSYEQISEVLHMPVGAIGPTRRRAIRRLHSMPAIVAFGHDSPIEERV